jgi:hypothetical protein
MGAAELLLPEPRSFEVEITIEKLKSYKSSCTCQILAELTQAGGPQNSHLYSE